MSSRSAAASPAPGGPPSRLLVVDLGRTGSRAALVEQGARGPLRSAPGVPGLGARDGAAQVLTVVTELAALVGADGDHDGAPIGAVAVGAAGVSAAPEAAAEVAGRLRDRWPGARVVLASDVLTTFLGALGGDEGVVVAAGTGAVTLAADRTRHVVLDGWGHLLGDDGSGYAIGRAGLRAALADEEARSVAGRGKAPPPGQADPLAERAHSRFGPLAQLPTAIASHPHPAGVIAAFARDVVELGELGEPTARAILIEAAVSLSRSALRARDQLGPSTQPVCLAGGLARAGSVLPEAFAAQVTAAGAPLRTPAGDALDGGVLLAAVEHAGRWGDLVHACP